MLELLNLIVIIQQPSYVSRATTAWLQTVSRDCAAESLGTGKRPIPAAGDHSRADSGVHGTVDRVDLQRCFRR